MKYLAMIAVTLLATFIIFVIIEVFKELKPYIRCLKYLAMGLVLIPFSSIKKIQIKALKCFIKSLNILIDTKSDDNDRYIYNRTRAEMLLLKIEGGKL